MDEHQDVFDVVCKRAGSQGSLAALCDVSPQAVSKWARTRRVPPEHCKLIEARLGVAAADIRPDIFGERVVA